SPTDGSTSGSAAGSCGTRSPKRRSRSRGSRRGRCSTRSARRSASPSTLGDAPGGGCLGPRSRRPGRARRVRRRRGLPPRPGGVKSTSYALNMVAVDEARRRGADDALFLGAEGVILEGPTTNVWWRRGRTLCTPALELGILAGVTRALLVRLASELGYGVSEA